MIAAPDTPDNVVANGQTIVVSGAGNTLAFVGSGTPDAGGQGSVYYTDGTTSSFTVTLDNSASEDKAEVTMAPIKQSRTVLAGLALIAGLAVGAAPQQAQALGNGLA